eukprot:TRINITY_DN2326_c0_g1_i4.p1 TRINITY_DN2326_c0_g1~~TRINITY_DN2326_c0_g1_i4.p1  ORF type:complete len:337 (+),score=111.34 TRINITY_DN2326_c0_g1_i4:154-1164(+)
MEIGLGQHHVLTPVDSIQGIQAIGTVEHAHHVVVADPGAVVHKEANGGAYSFSDDGSAKVPEMLELPSNYPKNMQPDFDASKDVHLFDYSGYNPQLQYKYYNCGFVFKENVFFRVNDMVMFANSRVPFAVGRIMHHTVTGKTYVLACDLKKSKTMSKAFYSIEKVVGQVNHESIPEVEECVADFLAQREVKKDEDKKAKEGKSDEIGPDGLPVVRPDGEKDHSQKKRKLDGAPPSPNSGPWQDPRLQPKIGVTATMNGLGTVASFLPSDFDTTESFEHQTLRGLLRDHARHQMNLEKLIESVQPRATFTSDQSLLSLISAVKHQGDLLSFLSRKFL